MSDDFFEIADDDVGGRVGLSSGLSSKDIHLFRRMAWNPDGTSRAARARELVREGITSRKSLIDRLDREWLERQRAGDESDDNASESENEEHLPVPVLDIRRGDFTHVLADCPTTKLILTDPPYAVESLPLWHKLAEFAAEKLEPGGSLIAYSGQSTLYAAHDILQSAGLRYWWTLAVLHAQSQHLPGKWVYVGWKPVLWFVKDTYGPGHFVADRLGPSQRRRTSDHPWAQGIDEVQGIIEALTEPGDLVIDPMCGSGSFGYAAEELGRRFLGADDGSASKLIPAGPGPDPR